MSINVFTQLNGVSLHYDRYDIKSGYGYGTRGKPFKPRATTKMIEKLDKCFGNIFELAPYSTPQVITSAGAYVNKTGQHGLGQAFDLDGIFWSEHELVANQYPLEPHLYLAVESVIRQYFGTVLAYNYNTAHKDHIHMDMSTSVKFEKMSKSRVEYLQASMFYIHGFQVGIDGVYGHETKLVLQEVLKYLQISGGIFKKTNWIEYLNISAIKGFDLA